MTPQERSTLVGGWSCPMPKEVDAEVLSRMVENHADKVDAVIERRLMHQLIMRYAEIEKQLLDLNQLKNRFLGIAAHDLRSPLSSIKCMGELMLEGSLGEINDSQTEMVDTIVCASRDMLSLVSNLLDIAAIESGKLRLRLEKGALRDLIAERIRLLGTCAKRKGMTFSVEVKDDPQVSFDRERIAQVLDNLLSNAIKFSPSGSVITIRLEQDGCMARVTVIDQGPGLTQDDRAQLFGEFQKLSARPTGGEASTGLGLAIAKSIMLAHDGLIGVQNADGKGAAFFFSLPVA